MATAVHEPPALSYPEADIERFFPHPNNRKHFDKTRMAELEASVKEKGVLVPLLVRPQPGNEAAEFQILAGERRWRAARKVGLDRLPYRLVALDDQQALEVLVVENLQREDVHPLEEAEGYQVLLLKKGVEVATIAAKVGKSVSYVYQRLKLNTLTEPAKKAFWDEKITSGHAILIARLPIQEQGEALAEMQQQERFGDAMSVRDLGDWIQDTLHLNLAAAPFKKDDAQLLPTAGACTVCPKRTGNQPDLFNDIKEKDQCTDRGCYNLKMAAFVANRAEELRNETGKPAVLVSQAGYGVKVPAGVLGEGKFREAGGKNCEDTVTALVVLGARRGQTIKVCLKGDKCKVHGWGGGYSSQRSSPSKQQLAANKAAKLKNDVHEAGRRRIWDEVGKKLDDDKTLAQRIPDSILEAVVFQVIARLWNDHAKLACRLLGLEIRKQKHAYGGTTYDPDGTLKAHAKSLDLGGKLRMLVKLSVVSHYDRRNMYYAGDQKDQLAALARHYKLNPESLATAAAREVKRKVAARAAKKTLQTSAKTQGKKKAKKGGK